MPNRFVFLLVGVVGVGAFACQSSGGARAARPSLPTAAQALGEAPRCAADQPLSPLVVDWPANRRAELEAAIARADGPLLVEHGCAGTRLLPDCRAKGARYAYEGVTLKEDVVRMGDADSVRTKLPTLGALLSSTLDARFAKGASLDLAMVTVGRHATGTTVGYRPSLAPSCRVATHFVKAVPVGAFALGVGARAEVRTAVQIFEGGVVDESISAIVRQARDGDLGTCRAGGREATTPPSGCGAPIRMEMLPLDARSEARARCEDRAFDDEGCTWWAGLAFTSPANPVETKLVMDRLVANCRAGRRGGCDTAAFYANHASAPAVDALWLAEQGCTLGSPVLCADHAATLVANGRQDEAAAALTHPCDVDEARCGALADLLEAGFGREGREGRKQRLADVRGRACMAGTHHCDAYARLFREGLTAHGDFAKMKKWVEQCRSAGDGITRHAHEMSCHFGAAALAFGLGVPRDVAKARELWTKHCDLGRSTSPVGTCRPFPWDVAPPASP